MKIHCIVVFSDVGISVVEVNFIIYPPVSGAKGARFKVNYDGPDDYLVTSSEMVYYSESVVSTFIGENVYNGVDVILHQCITEPTVIFIQDFFIISTVAKVGRLCFDEHPEGGLGIYTCDNLSLIQTCISEFSLSQYYDYGCYIVCPTVPVESSTWGFIKSIYTE